MFDVINIKIPFEVLLVTTTYLFSKMCQRRLAGALWPIRINKGTLAGHSGARIGITPVFTDSCFLSSCMNDGQETILFKI